MPDAVTVLRILFYGMSLLLAMNGWGQGLGVLVDDLHGRHRSAYEDAKSAKCVQLEIFDYSTEGGEAVGYFREPGELFLVDVRLFGEMGRSEYSFLWHDTGSFIFLERNFNYNRPFYLNEEEAKRMGDTEAFDPEKTVVLQRFAFFDEAKEVYTEFEPDTDSTLFMGPADLEAMMVTIQKRLIALYDAGQSTLSSVQVPRPIELMDRATPVQMDTALAGVALNDQVSAVKVLGTMHGVELVETERHPMPHASYSDTGKDAFVTFGLHYGAGVDQYAEMQMSRAEPDTLFGVLDHGVMRSSLGIQLGMNEEEVQAILGPVPTVGRSSNGHTLCRYHIEDLEGTGMLSGYGYPVYYVTAEFNATGLLEYRFGFEYP